jgi:apolipoprotein N-acyltransferase
LIKKAIIICKSNYYLLTCILIFLSFPSYDVWLFKGFPFFAWISLVPLFLYVRGKNIRDLYLVSFITGLGGYLLAYDWIGHFGQKLPGGQIFVMVILSLSLAVFFAIKVSVAEVLSARFEKVRVLIYPAVWIIVDWVESIGYLAFPWPYWGYSQYPFTAFIQLASLTGIMGVTFVIILFNYLLAELVCAWNSFTASWQQFFKQFLLIKETRRFSLILFFMLIVVLSGTSALLTHNNPVKKDMRVALIQSCISPWEDWENNKFRYLKELKEYTEESLKEGPDFLIWSESATLATISYDYMRGKLDDFNNEILEFTRACDRPLLTGEIGIIVKPDGLFLRHYPQNNAVLINRLGEVVKTYPKIHLVPFGEWFPYEKWFPAIKRLTLEFGGSSFVPGDKPVLFELDGRTFGVLICYEGIFHRLCRKYRNMGAEYLINITNDGWTHTYKGHMQHFAASIFRAVENGMWYIRAGNTGYTALIDPYGRVRKSMPILVKGYLAGDIDFSLNHSTVYSNIGDVLLYACIAFISLLTGWFLFGKIRIVFFNKPTP